jgi:16S rRNA (cytidine1402-2'-O)-methyltransferase
MPSGRFCFEGFLSTNKISRKEHLAEIVNEPRTMIFYEAPHKLLNTLNDLYAFLGDREIALVRELTKLHENVHRTTLRDAIEYYSENAPKGEFVLIIDGKREQRKEETTLEDAVKMAREFMENGMSSAAAAKAAANATSIKKSEIYKEIVK